MVDNFSPELYAYLTYSELFPNSNPDISYIKKNLIDCDLIPTIELLSRINLLLSDMEYAKIPQNQANLCKFFFNDYTLKRVKENFSTEKNVFNRQQILFMIKMSLLHCKTVGEKSTLTQKQKNKLGNSCLVINDFLTLLDVSNSKINSGSYYDKLEFIWKELMPNYEINNPVDIKYDIARNRLFFKKVLHLIPDNKKPFDLEDIFLKSTQLNLDDFINLIFACLAIYVEMRKNFKQRPQNLTIKKTAFTENSAISEDDANKILNLVSLPLCNYKEKILNSPDKDNIYGFLIFKKYPIVKLDKDNYLCLDLNYLLEKLSTGIFWIINDSLPKQSRNDFRSFWGNIFENYINHIFEEISRNSTISFIANPRLKNSDDEISDAVIINEKDVFLIETKFTTMTADAKYLDSIDSLKKEIVQKFEKNRKGEWKGYGQLSNSINKIFSDPSNYNHLFKLSDIKMIYPILIVNENFINSPFTNYILNRNFQSLLNFHSLKKYKHLQVLPLTIMTIQELEASIPFLEEISIFFQEWFSFNPDMKRSFSDLLISKYKDDSPIENFIVDTEYKKYSEEMTQKFFPKT
jgi:hypothetical protein